MNNVDFAVNLDYLSGEIATTEDLEALFYALGFMTVLIQNIEIKIDKIKKARQAEPRCSQERTASVIVKDD
jgi:hypothetical protein